MCVDSALPHLDRPFDYAIPPALLDTVAVGTRVRVRFAGRLVNAVVIELAPSTTFAGALTPINSAAGTPSYTARAIDLAQSVARRYGGSLWDVLRLMAPPRVASIEQREWAAKPVDLDAYRKAAPSLARGSDPELPVDALAAGARVLWQALPPRDNSSLPSAAILAPAVAVASLDQTALVIVPDSRSLADVERVLLAHGLKRWSARSGGHVAILDADDGANARYAAYLAAMHGHVRLVVGTRPVALQPVPELGFVGIWDEPSSTYDDPHAPYYNARTVAALRAELEGAGMLLAAYAPSVEALALAHHGWAEIHRPPPGAIRERVPLVTVLDDAKREAEGASGWHWMPGAAWREAHAAIARGPVAIVVPRAGYVRAVACQGCGAWATCRACGGALKQERATAPLECRDCSTSQHDWHCPECNGHRIRQVRQGVDRIVEQIIAMARGVEVHQSSSSAGVIADWTITAGFVVATPGALPAVVDGYAHAVVIGAEAPATHGLGAENKAVRWWTSVGALVRARARGGTMTLIGDLPPGARSALVTWDPLAAAEESLRERTELALPPATRTLRLTGTEAAVTLALSATIEGERIARHPDVTVARVRDGAVLFASRRIAQHLIDTLRLHEVEMSREGTDSIRLRVDGAVDLGATRRA